MVRGHSLMATVALALALVLAPRVASAEEHWPPEAEKRYKEALQLALHAEHAKAALLYRTVADWPEGGEFVERAQALYFAAKELEAGHDLERARDAYIEMERRYPASPLVPVARRAVEGLADLSFRREHEAAWDVLAPAMALHYRREHEASRPGLEKALVLLEALLRDHREHPRAVDVAVARSDVLVRLGRLEDACLAADDAIVLALREAAKPGAKNTVAADVANARRQLAEARQAIWARRLDWASKLTLLLLGVAFAAARPWQNVTRRLVKLGVVLGGVDMVLAVVAMITAEWVRRVQDLESPLSNSTTAILVLVPGAIGIALALGLAASYRGRRGAALAALSGVAGALAASICLVQRFGLSAAFVPGG